MTEWKTYFSKLYNEDNSDSGFNEHHLEYVNECLENGVQQITNTCTETLDGPISISEVKKAVICAKLKKASGIDDIPAEVLKNELCINMLHKLICYAFEQGVVPTDWQKGVIQPVPKGSSDDARVPNNYRGITLISVPCKIYCSILNSRLSSWLEANNILVEEQNGFRPDRSCLDHLYSLYNMINIQKGNKKSAFVCYIDARKAFDNVNRSCLWFKLQQHGIKGKMLSAIRSLYEDVQCSVRINGVLSDWFGVHNGVKQGCIVSPTLFALYVNDLATEIKTLNCGLSVGDHEYSILLFADDIALITDSEEKLQQMLNCLQLWCSKWRMSLNMGKTKIVHYRPTNMARSDFQFKVGDTDVGYVSKYKYLGLWLEEHLNMSETVKALSSSAGRALGSLITKFHCTGGMTYDIFTHLYDSLVAPVLNYGAGVWGTTSYSVVNKVQNRASRFFLGLGAKAPNLATRGDMGWISQEQRQFSEVSRLYYRAETIADNRMISLIHCFCKTRRTRTLWTNKVNRIFNNIDFDYKNTTCSLDVYMSLFNDSYKAHDLRHWYMDMQNDKKCINGNKLRIYRLHKDRITPEPYLTTNLTRYERSITAKLRSGTLPLEVEIGRYKNIPLDERICSKCQTAIEDEIHFSIDCEFYKDIRYNLFETLSYEFDQFHSSSSVVKYILMMKSKHVKLVGQSITKMFMRRKLYE